MGEAGSSGHLCPLAWPRAGISHATSNLSVLQCIHSNLSACHAEYRCMQAYADAHVCPCAHTDMYTPALHSLGRVSRES